MQTLKVSVSLPDATRPDVELRLSAIDSDCDAVITRPMQAAHTAAVAPTACDARPPHDDDDVLGGYAGIWPHSPNPYRCVSPKKDAIPEPSR
jgi:hypothetical protein